MWTVLLLNFAFAHAEILLPPLTQILDKESAGWAYKIDDQAFELKEPGCRVKWNVETPKAIERGLTLVVRETCSGQPERVQIFNRALLKAVSAKYSLAKVKSVIAHSWCARPEWSERMALAAIQHAKSASVAAQEYKFIFAAGDVAREERDLFAAQGLALSLSSVEKILSQPFAKFPFADKYPELKASQKRVPFSALCWFSLRPL